MKQLGGAAMNYNADRFWYLSSMTKVPIAIATLQQVDAGRLDLSGQVTLADGDKIEGGKLVWQQSGTRYSISDLFDRMLGDSDNTAANMLIRTVGHRQVNGSARAAMGSGGFGELTSFAQVRRDVYAELHPDARNLTNDTLVRIAAAPNGPARVENVRRALNRPASELAVKTIGDAYARYYASQRNSATLVAYGAMLERLVKGELLSPASTDRLFKAMKLGVYTNYRLQAGLPRGVTFIHKTGTQHLRACHAGVISPEAKGANAIVVAACTADLDEQRDAGVVLQRVGRAITAALLSDPAPANAR